MAEPQVEKRVSIRRATGPQRANPKKKMGDWLTDKQETFARELFSGKSQIDAYHIAYPKSLDWNISSAYGKASTLAKHAKIVARVEALRAPVAKRHNYGVDTAMDEAMQAFELAKEARQVGAMVAAAQLRAKLQGLLVERREIAVTQMSNMGPDEKAALISAANAELERRKALAGPVQSVTDIDPKPSST